MTVAIALIVGVSAGGSLAFLAGWVLRDLSRRRMRRNLASALIGEIAAVLRIVEVHDVVSRLARCADGPDAAELSLAGFALPQFVIFQSSARRLALLRSPLPRQIAYFYARLGGLKADLRTLAAARGERTEHSRTVLIELRETLDVADDILRGLRASVSKRRPSSISRA
ncbi:hypothetical protein SAMN05444161_9214 [Rhizobiales bacterium GAS191]|nr:hypothetical protein SAMN05444161_9214 [Rhizobiales bacterium GAS191]